MKILKTIPLTYIPLWRKQEVIYFTDRDDVKKYSLVLIEYGKKLVPALVTEILNLEQQKIYLKKIYDFKLKKIKKIISYRNFLNDQIYSLIKILEKKFFVPSSVILKYVIRKALYAKSQVIKDSAHPQKKPKDNKREPQVYIAHKDDLTKIKDLILSQVKKKRNVLILTSQYDSFYYYKEKLAKYFSLKIIELHAKLKNQEYQENFFKIQAEKGKIFMGLKHIIFSPFSELSLIVIIDELSPYQYQTQESPYLNFKIAGEFLAQIYKADIVYLNVFLPSLELFYKYQNKKALPLNERPIISNVDFDKIKIVYLKSYLDNSLIEQIKSSLKSRSKILILQNRKGYSVFVQCRDCNYIFYCRDCSRPLKYYKEEKKMICHICLRELSVPDTCPICKGFNFKLAGTGIEKIISIYRRIFKEIKFMKLDSLSLKTKKQKDLFYNLIKQEKKIIIVGTEASLDLKIRKFDLAIIPNIDIFFNFPSYNAFENLLFLIGRLTLVAKKIVLGTFSNIKNFSENFSYSKIQKLFEYNLQFRKKFNYPPFVNLINIQFSYKNRSKAYLEALKLKKELDKLFTSRIFGPFPCFIFKRENKYYYQINIKVADSEMIKLFDFIKQIKKQFKIFVNPIYL